MKACNTQFKAQGGSQWVQRRASVPEHRLMQACSGSCWHHRKDNDGTLSRSWCSPFLSSRIRPGPPHPLACSQIDTHRHHSPPRRAAVPRSAGPGPRRTLLSSLLHSSPACALLQASRAAQPTPPPQWSHALPGMSSSLLGLLLCPSPHRGDFKPRAEGGC